MARTPAALVGLVLRECRLREWQFDQAWSLAVRSLPRSQPDIMEWRAVLAELKPAWRDAYERNGHAAATLPAVVVSETAMVTLAVRVCEGASDEPSGIPSP
jgi:hypothetical protein